MCRSVVHDPETLFTANVMPKLIADLYRNSDIISHCLGCLRLVTDKFPHLFTTAQASGKLEDSKNAPNQHTESGLLSLIPTIVAP